MLKSIKAKYAEEALIDAAKTASLYEQAAVRCLCLHPLRNTINDGCQRYSDLHFGFGEDMRHVAAVSMLQRPQDHHVARGNVFIECAKAYPRRFAKGLDVGLGKAMFRKSALQPGINLVLNIQHS